VSQVADISTRAQHVILAVLDRHEESGDRPLRMPKALVRKELRHVAAVQGRAVVQVLRRTRNCGAVTAREIMEWAFGSMALDPHVCVCRHCGRRM